MPRPDSLLVPTTRLVSAAASCWMPAGRVVLLGLATLLGGAAAAHAGTGGAELPWNHPLQVVVDNLTGPTAKTIAALAFVLGGAMWMFTSHEQGAKRFGMALFGVAVVLGSVNLVDTLGFQGAIG
jgi:type IV secretory pathway VirB2 component (pilin)